MKIIFTVIAIIAITCNAYSQDDVCRVALESNAFNTFNNTVTNKIAFAKKEDICQREYESTEEFRNSARTSGFNVSYAGYGLGHSGGKKTGSGKLHFRDEQFCRSDQEQFAQEYASNTHVRVADVALNAWSQCIDSTRRNSLWLSYSVPPDGTGMVGTIFRTISSGRTTLKITSMQVHPNTADVSCTIEGRTFTREQLTDNAIITDTTKEIVECTKQANETIRVAFGTDGDSLLWVEMPSVEDRAVSDIQDLERRFNTFQKELEKLPAAVVAFNSAECPAGWIEFPQAAGRMIVGSGTGAGLTPRQFGTAGGSESVTLTIKEMPKHYHQQGAMRGSGSGGGANSIQASQGGDLVAHQRPTREEGGGESHDNMPPYIALKYCFRQ